MVDRSNYILLLGLDPSDPATGDWAIIEKCIETKRREWNRERSQGSRRRKLAAEKALSEVGDLIAVLSDAGSRRDEIRTALRLVQEERREALTELHNLIELHRARGWVPEKGVKRWEGIFKGRFDRPFIEERLHELGVRIGPPRMGGPKTAPAEPLDRVKAARIQDLCDTIGVESVYEFLDLRPMTSVEALRDRAVEICQEILRVGATDRISTARNELSGECQAIFESSDGKARYDTYLSQRTMQVLDASINEAGQEKFITARALSVLLRQAQEAGIGVEQAREYIEAFATRKSWGVERDQKLPIAERPRCGYCGTLGRTPDDSRCPACGEDFEQPCPRCGQSNPTDRPACRGCGCQIGNAPLVKSLLREAKRQWAAGESGDALRSAERALVYWPGWRPAEQLRDEIATEQARLETCIRDIENLVAARRCIEARGALLRLRRDGGTAPQLENTVEKAIARAEAAMARGDALVGRDPEAAVEHYGEAIRQCTDLAAAQAAIVKIPPPPVSALSVEEIHGGMRVSWQTPQARGGLVFRLLRRPSGRPADVDDGDVLGELSSKSYDDIGVEPGVPWYYALYTIRGGVASADCAWSGPHLRLAEVTDLVAVPGDGQVALSWSRPTGCQGVEVCREVGRAPTRLGLGTPVRVSGDAALDTALTNGRAYGYRVVALFPDPCRAGAMLRSKGVVLTATPAAPPHPIDDLRCIRVDRIVQLQWTPTPAPATSHIRYRVGKPKVLSGQVVSTANLQAVGAPIPNMAPGRAQHVLTGQGRVYFIPINLHGDVAVVGEARPVTALDGVSDVRSQVSGSSIHLSWVWPAGVDEVRVRWSHDDYPREATGGGACSARVTKAEYGRRGTWSIDNVPRKAHYISVFARSDDGVYAEPGRWLEPVGSAVNLRYQVRLIRQGLLRRVRGAVVDIDASEVTDGFLPPIVVVGRPGRTPVGRDDGEVLVREPAAEVSRGRTEIRLPETALGRNLSVRLFFEDAAHAQLYRLMPDRSDCLRVG